MKMAEYLMAVLAASIMADMPDYSLSWNFMETAEEDGDHVFCDCIFYEDRSLIQVVCLIGVDTETELRVLKYDLEGTLLESDNPLNDTIDNLDYVIPGFIDENTLIIAHSPAPEAGGPSLQVIDLSNQGDSYILSLDGICPDAERFRIVSIEPTDSGRVFVAGDAFYTGNIVSLFVGCIDQEGTVLWQTRLFEYSDFSLNGITLAQLEDGGCFLSYAEDAFPTGIPVARLDENGTIAWTDFIELDCEFTAAFNDFSESENGNILCAGGFDQLGQMAFRGLLVCFDSNGQELWRRTDWYLDHTSFVSFVENCMMVFGWTGSEGSYPFEVDDMDILLAGFDASGKSITGYLVEATGNQRPFAVFEMSEGELYVVGEHSSLNDEDRSIFLGRIDITESRGE